jgi:hypothetical protein
MKTKLGLTRATELVRYAFNRDEGGVGVQKEDLSRMGDPLTVLARAYAVRPADHHPGPVVGPYRAQ